MRWNDSAQRWEPQATPPPPPEAGETGPALSGYDASSYQASPYQTGQASAGMAYGQPYVGRRTNGKAIGALITGIVGLLVCGLLGPVAMGLGFSARKEIARSGGYETGQGMATAGIVMGCISVALLALLLVVIILPAGSEL